MSICEIKMIVIFTSPALDLYKSAPAMTSAHRYRYNKRRNCKKWKHANWVFARSARLLNVSMFTALSYSWTFLCLFYLFCSRLYSVSNRNSIIDVFNDRVLVLSYLIVLGFWDVVKVGQRYNQHWLCDCGFC